MVAHENCLGPLKNSPAQATQQGDVSGGDFCGYSGLSEEEPQSPSGRPTGEEWARRGRREAWGGRRVGLKWETPEDYYTLMVIQKER